MPSRLPLPNEGNGQHTKRSMTVFFDQHKSPEHPEGRPWWGWTEAAADPRHPKGVVGELLPVSATMTVEGMTIRGWDAPWLPEAKYIAASVGSITGNRFKINYLAQIADYRTANERYYSSANEEAMSRNLPGVKMYGAVPFQIRSLKHVGNPPKSPKLPEAAQAGDPWILYGHGANEQLKAIIDRDNGRMTLSEAENDAAAEENPLESLSQEDRDDLLAFVRERRQKNAKKSQATSSAA